MVHGVVQGQHTAGLYSSNQMFQYSTSNKELITGLFQFGSILLLISARGFGVQGLGPEVRS